MRKIRHGMALAVMSPVFLLTGCSGTITRWDALGSWNGTLVPEDGVARPISSTVSRTEGITADEEIRACDLRKLSWESPATRARWETWRRS